jgi:hypothetical protein
MQVSRSRTSNQLSTVYDPLRKQETKQKGEFSCCEWRVRGEEKVYQDDI